MLCFDTLMDILPTPCGEITVTDNKGSRIPFTLQKSIIDTDYHVFEHTQNEKAVHIEHAYLLTIDIDHLQKEILYQIRLNGAKLRYGYSDESTECISGSSNGYSIAIGAFDPNDDEKVAQAFSYSKAQGITYAIVPPPEYDESKFSQYDVEMLEDFSGFWFRLIDTQHPIIQFPVAWIKNEPGAEIEYEWVVECWTTY